MKSLLKSCTVLASILSMTTAAVAQEPLQALGAGEGALSIVAWAGYIERGETDKNFDWVTEFEKKTGCMVSVKTAATSDEMVALMNEGGFDLVTASGDASLRLVAGKRVQPINTALIPSWSTIDERLQNAPWHTKDGVHYGTPYVWGPNVLMYNTQAFGDKAPDSWNVVFEEMTLADGKSNKGRVQAYDGPIHVADAANYLMFHKPELGIKDPFELNEDQYKAALDLLRVQRTLVSRYWHDAFIQIDDFKNEGVVASGSWPFQVNLLKADQPIASVFPKEGVTGWADTTMLHAESEHPNCAYMWMEHSLSPKVQGDVSAWFGTVPSVPAACKGNALLTDEGCTRNGFDNFEKIKFWKTPVSKCESQGECVPYHRWVSDYIGVIGGR
ncbi:MAG: ABC transporter substrate-binding protein [Rhizobium sp.]|uniref:ABC transporter substrate-binding protein n=1 Tax=Agrobacterium sp. MA01 TaxID=2664893 RepID=UPI00129B8623|nr:ABC transporter substrate-binding protein [Agrobacterium sp. MA01]MDM7981931.1 ABC transporter substrate-binding protein [Rhizobium sp.]MDM8012619.1 ABC transporter substrate-binding protein [Rhizobium sp.]MDZ7873726.1 ABC transporter substrate-binding protein [Rhizobium sp.]QGG91684.1 extracellular solute-binding protein [Agrobacterium sp. MA01]